MRFERITFPMLAVLAVLAVLGAGDASAQTPRGDDAAAADASASLDLEAAPDCASRAALIGRVGTRAPRVRFVAANDRTSALRVTITSAPRSGMSGELTVVRPGGKRSVRRIVAPTCPEVVDALALIIAITLDPAHANTDAGPPATTGVDPAAAAAAPASPVSTVAPVETPPASKPPPAAEIVAAEPESPPIAARSWLAVGVGARVTDGPAPRIMPGVSLHLQGGIDRASPWSPALRLGYAHTGVAGLLEEGGTAAFTLDTGSLDACPLRLRIPHFDLRPCATATLGRLTAQGSYTYSPRVQQRQFVTVGASALIGVTLGRRFEVGLRIAAGIPRVRYIFQFDPEVFYRVASVTLEGDLGLAIRFP